MKGKERKKIDDGQRLLQNAVYCFKVVWKLVVIKEISKRARVQWISKSSLAHLTKVKVK